MPKPLDHFPHGNQALADVGKSWGAFWALVFEAADAFDEVWREEDGAEEAGTPDEQKT